MNIKAYRQIAETEGESNREFFKTIDREALEDIAVGLSTDACYWKTLYMRASNNTPPSELK